MKRYAKKFEPKYDKSCNAIGGYTPKTPYFIGESGLLYDYAGIKNQLNRLDNWRELVGKHIFVQLEALGLLCEFDNGQTPCQLPASFMPAVPAIL